MCAQISCAMGTCSWGLGGLGAHRNLEVWSQLPQESDQLKREKVELATTLLQLLKEVLRQSRDPASLNCSHLLPSGL